MREYGKDDLLRLAKRDHNTKRQYLLINPLQGKHMPVSPTSALKMMRTLGAKIQLDEPRIDLVIGFAETATAVAAAAAEGIGHACRYIHTTRESFINGHSVKFYEEHSHAVEQHLSLLRLKHWIEEASTISFIDDELSTGRTLVNAVQQINQACPSIAGKRILASSIISRLSDDREKELSLQGIRCISLLRLPMGDYTKAVRKYNIYGANEPTNNPINVSILSIPPTTEDPRLGVSLEDWMKQLRECAKSLTSILRAQLAGRHVTIIGTEEYMLPGLLLGEELESIDVAKSVRFHATTRSPIGICKTDDYPIQSGWRLHSFYDASRPTFIYNLEPCDIAVIYTDSPDDTAVASALSDLASALAESGCQEAILIREASHVQYL